MPTLDFVEAVPINGYLTHAIVNTPANFHRTAPWLLITYNRALCGVGRGGMKVRLNQERNPLPWKGIDGCDTCHVKMRKIKAGDD